MPCPPPRDLPNPRIKPRSPSLQADSLPPGPPAKPKHTGVGSLSLLQGIFLTQESIKLGSPPSQMDSLPAESPGKPLQPLSTSQLCSMVTSSPSGRQKYTKLPEAGNHDAVRTRNWPVCKGPAAQECHSAPERAQEPQHSSKLCLFLLGPFSRTQAPCGSAGQRAQT